jgi:ureidoacrylate peracid hydrolase
MPAVSERTVKLERIEPTSTRILVVDVQNDFCATGGWFDRHGNDLTSIQEAVERLMRFLPTARQAGVRPVFIRAIYDDIYLSDPMRERHKNLGFEPDSCQSGTWGADFFRVRPEEGELSVAKHRYSAFIDTELNAYLRAQHVSNLIMCGVTSNVCVESTARDAFMLDYHVVFLSDCAATYDPAAHEATLANIRRAFGMVASADEVTAVWEAAGLVGAAGEVADARGG